MFWSCIGSFLLSLWSPAESIPGCEVMESSVLVPARRDGWGERRGTSGALVAVIKGTHRVHYPAWQKSVSRSLMVELSLILLSGQGEQMPGPKSINFLPRKVNP